jgi:ABC-type sugar transport system substrate-binding protein
VYNAIGGKVVEFSRYDRKSDRHNHDIYIISKNEDFGEKIAKIATLESLKD